MRNNIIILLFLLLFTLCSCDFKINDTIHEEQSNIDNNQHSNNQESINEDIFSMGIYKLGGIYNPISLNVLKNYMLEHEVNEMTVSYYAVIKDIIRPYSGVSGTADLLVQSDELEYLLTNVVMDYFNVIEVNDKVVICSTFNIENDHLIINDGSFLQRLDNDKEQFEIGKSKLHPATFEIANLKRFINVENLESDLVLEDEIYCQVFLGEKTDATNDYINKGIFTNIPNDSAFLGHENIFKFQVVVKKETKDICLIYIDEPYEYTFEQVLQNENYNINSLNSISFYSLGRAGFNFMGNNEVIEKRSKTEYLTIEKTNDNFEQILNILRNLKFNSDSSKNYENVKNNQYMGGFDYTINDKYRADYLFLEFDNATLKLPIDNCFRLQLFDNEFEIQDLFDYKLMYSDALKLDIYKNPNLSKNYYSVNSLDLLSIFNLDVLKSIDEYSYSVNDLNILTSDELIKILIHFQNYVMTAWGIQSGDNIGQGYFGKIDEFVTLRLKNSDEFIFNNKTIDDYYENHLKDVKLNLNYASFETEDMMMYYLYRLSKLRYIKTSESMYYKEN